MRGLAKVLAFVAGVALLAKVFGDVVLWSAGMGLLSPTGLLYALFG